MDVNEFGFPEVLQEASDRDPRQYPYGYFVSDVVGIFTWFRTTDELFDTFVDAEPTVYGSDSEPGGNKLAEGLEAVRRRVKRPVVLGGKLRGEINDVLGDSADLEWWGQLEDLLKGSGEFETDLRAWFRESQGVVEGETEEEEEGDEDSDGDPSRPIESYEVEEFLDYLRDYGH
jgi:hypothetical protein